MLKTARRIGAASAVALVASLSALAQTSTWNIDPAHSTAQFTVRHLGISNVTGSFTKVTGTVVLNDRDITQSEVSATIDVNSVDTRVEARDKDLKSPHFFEIEKYPTIEFKSKKIVSSGGRLQVIGDLTINRKDFNLLYNNLVKTGEAVVGDTVKIQIDAEMVRKK